MPTSGEDYRDHVVRQGDDMISIGQLYGLPPDYIWGDDANEEVRGLCPGPHALYPGLTLKIPPVRPRTVACATEKKHTFRRKGVPEKFVVHLQADEAPRAGVQYELSTETQKFSGMTDATGKIEHWVSPGARAGKLLIYGEDGPIEHPVKLGHLNPEDWHSGVRARLENLGFLARDSADEASFEAAIESFQRRYELKVTGKPGKATRSKLVEVHGS